MMKNLAMAIGVVLGVAAIVAAVFFFNLLDIGSRPRMLVGQNVNFHGGEAEKPLAHPSDIQIVNTRTLPMLREDSDLSFRLEQARDYRVLFESILNGKSPKAGLYAMQILRICANARNDPVMTSSSSIQQDRARELWAARCATFTDEELSDTRRLGLVADPRLQGGLTDLLRAWYSAGLDSEKRKSSLAAIFQSGDPLLLAHVATTVMYQPETTGYVFNGVEYKKEMDTLLLYTWYAAACEGTNALCGSTDDHVVETCARTGLCASTRLELAEQQGQIQYGEEGLLIFKTIYPQMVAAIRNRDVSPFVK